jgi:hypothetical protein
MPSIVFLGIDRFEVIEKVLHEGLNVSYFVTYEPESKITQFVSKLRLPWSLFQYDENRENLEYYYLNLISHISSCDALIILDWNLKIHDTFLTHYKDKIILGEKLNTEVILQEIKNKVQ